MTAVGSLGNSDMGYRVDVAPGISANNPATGAGRLVLPIWAGEVINAYDQYNIFESMVDSKTISSGTVMEFPVTGYVDLKSTWNAGEELTGGTNSKATTFRIALDKRPMAAHFELDNVDLMLTQWEFRSELAKQAGRTLADARDRQIAAYLCRAAAENGLAQDPRATDWFGGSAVGGLGGKVFCNNKFDNLGLSTASAANRTDAALKLLEKIEEFQIRLQEVDAPTEGVFCAVTPRTFQDIRALGVARDSSDLAGGAGRPFFGGVADAGGLGAGLGQGMVCRYVYGGVPIGPLEPDVLPCGQVDCCDYIEHEGACCKVDTEECEFTTYNDCASQGGVFMGPGTNCPGEGAGVREVNCCFDEGLIRSSIPEGTEHIVTTPNPFSDYVPAVSANEINMQVNIDGVCVWMFCDPNNCPYPRCE